MPQKEMRQHRRQHMVVPAWIFAYLIVVHPELGFAFFKALFHGPAQPLSQTKVRQGVLAEALLIEYAYVGSPPVSA